MKPYLQMDEKLWVDRNEPTVIIDCDGATFARCQNPEDAAEMVRRWNTAVLPETPAQQKERIRKELVRAGELRAHGWTFKEIAEIMALPNATMARDRFLQYQKNKKPE